MIIKENDKYIIYYDEEILYIDEVIEYLDSRIGNILNYFGLNDLRGKKKIILWNDLNSYIKHLEKYTTYKDEMCADTFDGNVNMLTISEARKTSEHKDMTLMDFKRNITHEFVHICQQELEVEKLPKNINDIWFWEMLATNLGNYESFEIIKFNITYDELLDFNNLKNNYSIVYTIGRYMLEKYTREEIIEFVKYPTKLVIVAPIILNEAIEWVNNNTKSI